MNGVLTRKTTFLVRCVKRAYTRITVASRCRTELGARVSVIDSGLIQSAEFASTLAFSGWCADHLSSPARIPKRPLFFFHAFPLTFRSRSHCGIKRSIVDRLTADLEKMVVRRKKERSAPSRQPKNRVTLMFYFSLVKNHRVLASVHRFWDIPRGGIQSRGKVYI